MYVLRDDNSLEKNKINLGRFVLPRMIEVKHVKNRFTKASRISVLDVPTMSYYNEKKWEKKSYTIISPICDAKIVASSFNSHCKFDVSFNHVHG